MTFRHEQDLSIEHDRPFLTRRTCTVACTGTTSAQDQAVVYRSISAGNASVVESVNLEKYTGSRMMGFPIEFCHFFRSRPFGQLSIVLVQYNTSQ